MKKDKNRVGKAFRAAFPHTLPIFAAFLVLGVTYGIYMNTSGFSFWYPMFISLLVLAGSFEFLMVGMLAAGPFNPIQVFLMAFMINARHLFYGLSMLDKYKDTGMKKLYLIYGMCDETFSINCATTVPEDVDKGWFYFFVTLLNHSYWVFGATLGGICGTFLRFNANGIEFAMTAMFVAIFIDQCRKDKNHVSAVVGIVVSLICLLIFGADRFVIPSMVSILIILTVLRKPLENGKGGQLI